MNILGRVSADTRGTKFTEVQQDGVSKVYDPIPPIKYRTGEVPPFAKKQDAT